MSPPLEQPSAVRSFYAGAEESFGIASYLHVAVEEHGISALAFTRTWLADPGASDPSRIRETFARVELLHEQLGALISQQRSALQELPARLLVQPDPGREAVVQDLKRRGIEPA